MYGQSSIEFFIVVGFLFLLTSFILTAHLSKLVMIKTALEGEKAYYVIKMLDNDIRMVVSSSTNSSISREYTFPPTITAILFQDDLMKVYLADGDKLLFKYRLPFTGRKNLWHPKHEKITLVKGEEKIEVVVG